MSKYLDFEGLSYYNEQINPAIINAIDDTTKNYITSTVSGTGDNFNGTFTYTGNGTWHVEGTTTGYDSYVNLERITLSECNLNIGDTIVIKHTSDTDDLFMSLIPHSTTQGYLYKVTNNNVNKFAQCTIDSDVDYFLLRLQCTFQNQGGVVIDGNITPMFCKYENYKLSNKVIPYTMSNQEITETIRNPISNSDIDDVWGS